MPTPPIDRYQRRIDYLRLSITDRCNLRCVYCMPEGGVPHIDHNDILRYEEILRLVRISSNIGISKVRITGGEPLVRKDAVYLCKQITSLPGIESVSITTNGFLLEQYAKALYAAGIRRINVSLDTLDSDRFHKITRCNVFDRVWSGIQLAHRTGFHPIKINVVVMRGVNDEEIEELASLTYKYPFHVRFIEFMPFRGEEYDNRFLSCDEVRERLRAMDRLIPVNSSHSNGPAEHFQFPEALGKIGMISPVSHHFCATCNRLRITADGRLRTCLFAAEEIDLKEPLRRGASDLELTRILRDAISKKPEKHDLDRGITRKCISRPMSAIGG